MATDARMSGLNESLVFVDTETTGLDPDRHGIWEVAAIYWDKFWVGGPDGQEEWGWREQTWFVDHDLGQADSFALKLTDYHQRIKGQSITKLEPFARDFARITRGKHLVGAVPSFDEERLRKLLRANGACPEWHHHLVDVEALAVGYLAAKGIPFEMPWDSDELSKALGITPDTHRHEALYDAQWAKRIWTAVTGGR